MSSPSETQSGRVTKVVVATSVMLSFISFWRAAAIVLNDLGSSAFYVGGIAEQAVGQAAPWFILGVMLFSYAVRSVYIESCAMFTRGWRLSRRQGSNGGHAGQAFGLRFDVRLHFDWARSQACLRANTSWGSWLKPSPISVIPGSPRKTPLIMWLL